VTPGGGSRTFRGVSNSALRRAAAGFGILVLAAAVSAPTNAQTASDARTPCLRALVAMDDTVDSSHAKSGDVFKFRIIDAGIAPDGTAIPAGSLGYGVVANASHAERGGRAGYLALETRFFVMGDGKHVPAIIDRANDQASVAIGSTANAPGLLGLIPIVGYAVGGYDSLHHGKDATIPRGTRVAIFIGDDAALGTCRPLAAGESPPPAPTASPAAPATAAPQSAAPPSSMAPAPAGAAATPGIPPPPPVPAPARTPTASPTA
jgi:hypothetical protein